MGMYNVNSYGQYFDMNDDILKIRRDLKDAILHGI